jgi:glucokinase
MPKKTKVVLAGDIGGTKTFLGVFEKKGEGMRPLRVERFLNSGHRTFEGLLGHFLASVGLIRIGSACLGVASPIKDNSCRLTNAAWRIDGASIKKRFNIPEVILINDLVATGLGIGLLKKNDFHALKKARPKKGNIAVISAGTGLGEAILAWDGLRHIPIAGEGGHSDFAPSGAMQAGLLSYLNKKFGHASYERALSGQGLKNIFDFLNLKKRQGMTPALLKKRLMAEDSAKVIAEEALKGKDHVCRDALRMFVMIYGAEAGNLALKVMAKGGVFVGGGIAPRILSVMRQWGFIDAFHDKGRFSGFMKDIPVYVILNEKVALFGAARKALSGHNGLGL